MPDTLVFAPGGYRFIPGPFQYSAGVSAESGLRIVRVRFSEPVPLAEGFHAIARIITGAGRPLTAFCACELRSPAPFTDAGFIAFNKIYVGTLAQWGLFGGTTNPVARSNVCPEIAPPAVPSFHAFSYTEAASGAAPSFVIAGSGEAREGKGSYAERIVRLGDTSPDGLREKACFVLDVMEKRLRLFGVAWPATTAAQVYSVHDIHPLMAAEIVPRGAALHGLTWHYCRPPVVGLDYEMDCRSVAVEQLVQAK